jgi:hypothetical protein
MSETSEPYGSYVTTLDELNSLDPNEMREGYSDGKLNEPQPSGNRSKSYWHGWRNGMMDGGHMPIDAAARELARVVVQNRTLRTPQGD